MADGGAQPRFVGGAAGEAFYRKHRLNVCHWAGLTTEKHAHIVSAMSRERVWTLFGRSPVLSRTHWSFKDCEIHFCIYSDMRSQGGEVPALLANPDRVVGAAWGALPCAYQIGRSGKRHEGFFFC